MSTKISDSDFLSLQSVQDIVERACGESHLTVLSYNVTLPANLLLRNSGILYVSLTDHDEIVYNLSFTIKFYRKFQRRNASPANTCLADLDTWCYIVVIPALEEFEHQYCRGSSMLCECYYTRISLEADTLVLENLALQGYKKADRLLDLNHVMLVVKSLAKFHATSYAMQKKIGFDFQKQFPFLFQDEEVANRKFFYGNIVLPYLMSVLRKILEGYVVSVDDIKRKLLCVFQKFVKILENMNKVSDGFCAVLNGNCSPNNLMFSYDDAIPESVKILHFHNALVGHPAEELSYFLYMSSSTSLRRQKLSFLLKTYYEAFFRMFIVFKTKTWEEVDLDGFVEEYRRKSMCGFVFALAMLPLAHANLDDLPGVGVAHQKSLLQLKDAFQKTALSDEVKVLMRDMIIEVQETGLLDLWSSPIDNSSL